MAEVNDERADSFGNLQPPFPGTGGYYKFGPLMSQSPGHAILRHFLLLNALNLLHFQAALTELEGPLKSHVDSDENSISLTDRLRVSREYVLQAFHQLSQ